MNPFRNSYGKVLFLFLFSTDNVGVEIFALVLEVILEKIPK